MLRELHVRNLAVLAEASVELGEGLNVLTGETGAGKSIIVDSLSLLAGARAAGELIRTDAETLTVAGVFSPAGDDWRRLLAEAGVEVDGDELLARREISRSGRNRVFVNDQPTTLRLLADLAPHLLRIHGQREELGLVDPELQRRWLDKSGGEAAAELTGRVAAAHDHYARLAARLERLSGDERLRGERLDLARFQAGELAAASPMPGEETALRAERDALRNREAIAHALGGTVELLFDDEGAAVDRIAKSQALLAEIADWEPQVTSWDSELAEARVRLEEAAAAVRRRLDGLEADPRRLDEIEERLAALERLFRKHRVTTAAELAARRSELDTEVAELEGDAADRGELERQTAAALVAYRGAALELSARRREWGEALAAAIAGELGDLGLGKARLAVALSRRGREGSPLMVGGEAVEFGRHGVDAVTIEFAPNPGEAPRPLSLIASGGELSRIYLALQLAVRAGGGEGAPTLVFDEVDSGVGGAQAAALGKKLQRLGGSAQVLVVTHLPQVASFADHHFKVEKSVRAGRTRTAVGGLDDAGRVEEIARMLGGETVTALSRQHAEELLAAADEGRSGAPSPGVPRRARGGR